MKYQRIGRRVGERHQAAKLTAEQVLEMRRTWRPHSRGAFTITAFARRFGVGSRTVWEAINRKTWRHLP